MNDLPRQKLSEIVAAYGRSVAEDPRRCEGLLRDLSGEHRREINVLVAALKQRVPVALLGSQTGMPRQAMIARLTQQLHEDQGLTEDVARWAVESWALALGVVSPEDIAAEPTPEVPEPEVEPAPRPRSNDATVDAAAHARTHVRQTELVAPPIPFPWGKRLLAAAVVCALAALPFLARRSPPTDAGRPAQTHQTLRSVESEIEIARQMVQEIRSDQQRLLNNPPDPRDLGSLLRARRNKAEEALKHARGALTLAPGNAAAREAEAEALAVLAEGEAQSARALIEEVNDAIRRVKRPRNPPLTQEEANAIKQALRTKCSDALAHCERALALDAQNRTACIQRVRAYRLLADYSSARSALRAALALYPNSVELRDLKDLIDRGADGSPGRP